ncbi:dihydrolipoyl dehydrogenase family protein [Lacticaseibacillus sp. N501-2]|uniref:dihydrolipoyl dehydrogenase family protein n=1 Tax=Lacticaseibacillus salsurae TaxID=3367729 RepID=UPI0038B28D7B
MNHYDVIIIGAGPAGVAAASALADHKRVMVFERDLWGGTCPNRGCDPKKMLYRAAELKTATRDMQPAGVRGELTINWPELMAHKRSYTSTVPGGTLTGLHAAGVNTRHGELEFFNRHTVALAGDLFDADDIIIATGRKPAKPDIPGAELLKTSNEFLDLDQLPQRIAFIGAGYVSVELANIAAAAGADVHIINRSETILRGWDERATATLKQAMTNVHIHWHDNIHLESVAKSDQGVWLHGEDGFSLNVNAAFAATGRSADLGIDLAPIGLEMTAKGLPVNEFMQTKIPHIYAIGDAVDKTQPKLTPVASFEGRYVAKHLLGMSEPIAYPVIPEIVFGTTEIARVGVDLQTAKADPDRYQVLDQDVSNWYTYHRTLDHTARVATIRDRQTQLLVGALVVGDHAEELINQFTLLIQQHQAFDPQQVLFAYPSASSDLSYLL